MNEFLDTALSFPTVAFTTALGVVLLYWISVMVGALDLDVLDPGGALDGVDGAVDGAVDGVLEGVDAAGDAAAAGVELDVDLDADLDGDAPSGGLGGLLHALKLRYAPLTVVFSFLSLFGWLGAFFGSRYLEGLLPFGGFLAGFAVALAALIVAWPLTSLVTRPLAPLFKTHPAKRNQDLIGSVVTVKTGKVDRAFGQATLDDGQAGLLLKVRCEDPEALARGDRALIVSWDETDNSFEVEPMDALLHDKDAREKRRRR